MKNESYVIETVIFRANPVYTNEEVQSALTSLNDVLKLYYGFIDRFTGVTEEGKYIDLVYWTDIESAKAAATEIIKNEKAKASFQVIIPESMEMHHFDVFNHFEE